MQAGEMYFENEDEAVAKGVANQDLEGFQDYCFFYDDGNAKEGPAFDFEVALEGHACKSEFAVESHEGHASNSEIAPGGPASESPTLDIKVIAEGADFNSKVASDISNKHPASYDNDNDDDDGDEDEDDGNDGKCYNFVNNDFNTPYVNDECQDTLQGYPESDIGKTTATYPGECYGEWRHHTAPVTHCEVEAPVPALFVMNRKKHADNDWSWGNVVSTRVHFMLVYRVNKECHS